MCTGIHVIVLNVQGSYIQLIWLVIMVVCFFNSDKLRGKLFSSFFFCNLIENASLTKMPEDDMDPKSFLS